MSEFQFFASIPQIQSAISIGGDQSGRIKLDVPGSEFAEVMKMAAYGSGKLLKITVEVQED